jgi:hypothetical protein
MYKEPKDERCGTIQRGSLAIHTPAHCGTSRLKRFAESLRAILYSPVRMEDEAIPKPAVVKGRLQSGNSHMNGLHIGTSLLITQPRKRLFPSQGTGICAPVSQAVSIPLTIL